LKHNPSFWLSLLVCFQFTSAYRDPGRFHGITLGPLIATKLTRQPVGYFCVPVVKVAAESPFFCTQNLTCKP
jgi:hypothetical protein